MTTILLLVLGLFGSFGGMAQGQAMIGYDYTEGYLVWWDKGSGADRDFSCRSAYQLNNVAFIVGHNGQANYNDNMATRSFNLRAWWDGGALARPERFDFIWNDAGSGADLDGTVFRPVCPTGYVSLGDVMFQGHGDPPAQLYNDVRCVKQAYTEQCEFGNEIWADHGSGADRDVKMLAVRCNQGGMLTTDFFYASDKYYANPNTTPYAVRWQDVGNRLY